MALKRLELLNTPASALTETRNLYTDGHTHTQADRHKDRQADSGIMTPKNIRFAGLLKSLLKTLQEKEKMLETIIFSFSYNAFNPIKEKFHNLSHNEIVVCKCCKFRQS